MGRIGILGGTFNPPHLGHLALARCALGALELERVLLMPARVPPHKLAESDPGPRERLRMCELLCEDEDAITACELELRREGPSYTVDTLTELHARAPEPVQLTFIAGADAARSLPRWRDPQGVLELAELAVAARGGTESAQVRAALRPLAGESVRFLEMEPVEISSSLVRERAARGEPLQELVGERVASYIAAHGLYRTGGGVADAPR